LLVKCGASTLAILIRTLPAPTPIVLAAVIDSLDASYTSGPANYLRAGTNRWIDFLIAINSLD
jgi:hypothetical protein